MSLKKILKKRGFKRIFYNYSFVCYICINNKNSNIIRSNEDEQLGTRVYIISTRSKLYICHVSEYLLKIP